VAALGWMCVYFLPWTRGTWDDARAAAGGGGGFTARTAPSLYHLRRACLHERLPPQADVGMRRHRTWRGMAWALTTTSYLATCALPPLFSNAQKDYRARRCLPTPRLDYHVRLNPAPTTVATARTELRPLPFCTAVAAALQSATSGVDVGMATSAIDSTTW